MAHITRETLDNCFILIDGAIPNSDSLKEQYPHRRPMIRLDTGRFPPCEEERKAYLLTAHAMDIYARMAHGRVAEGGLETWVLNRSESGDGALDPWFEGQPEDYRVCIHRIGTDNGYSGSRPLRFCWGRAYARLGVTGKISVDAPLVENPQKAGVAQLGVSLRDRPRYDFPVDVTIDSGDVGGPSAGLAFTLALIDVLSPGDLTGGKRVAVTGTIDLDLGRSDD